jgi:hypothetical protein
VPSETKNTVRLGMSVDRASNPQVVGG